MKFLNVLITNESVKLISDIQVKAGFPSPAQDHLENDIKLIDLLTIHPEATFFVAVSGDSMKDAYIPDEATLVVDRSVTPSHKDIILAFVNGQYTVKRLIKKGKQIILKPENPKYKALEITEDMEFIIWGVVQNVIINRKQLRK